MVSLRPDLVINQEFVTQAPNVADTNLPVLLIGMNRAFNYQVDLGISGWTGATVITNHDLPDWLGGAVHPVADDNVTLRPRMFVSGNYGVAELLSGVSLSNLSTAPTVSLAAGISATFELASGTSGSFNVDTLAPLESQFTDANADFIVAQIADGDIIKVGGYDTFVVADQGLVADDELKVARLDKGSSRYAASQAAKYFLSEEDSNGLRQMITLSTGFSADGGFNSTGAAAGDLVNVNYHDELITNAGISFTKVDDTTGERTLTLPDALGYEADNPGAWDNTLGTGGVWFLITDSGNYEPAFYATSLASAVNPQELTVKDYATNKLTDLTNVDLGTLARYYAYDSLLLSSGQGAFTTLSGGERTFTDLSGPDFSGGGLGIAAGDQIAIADMDGVYRPVFEVVSQDSETQLTVSQFGTVIASTVVASNVDYKIIQASGGAVLEGTAATLAADGGDQYSITQVAATFLTAGVAAGDLVFTPSGDLMALVIDVPSETEITLSAHPNASVSAANFVGVGSFSYSIRQDAPSAFVVTRVIDGDTLEVRELSSSPNAVPSAVTANGFISFGTEPAISVGPTVDSYGEDINTVVAGDSLSSLSYTIEKTLTGSALTGTLLLSYVEDRNDMLTAPVLVNDDTYAALVGPAVPDNPLGLAASIVAQNTDTTFYVLQVATDDSTGWSAAFDSAKVDTVYSIVPLTANDTIIALAQAHTLEQSLPLNKRPRILWQSKVVPTQETRYTVTSSDGTLLDKSAVGVTTVTVPLNLVAQGVIVGDTFTGVASNGTSDTTFTGRITVISVVGSETTLTLIADPAIALSTADQVVSSYSITSKALTQTEHALAVAEYLLSVSERRVRNIFPSTYEMSFTDTTGGFYVAEGAASLVVEDYEVGGQYCAAEAAALKATYGPVKPLTGAAGAAFSAVNDPFAGNATLQDLVIDAGGYYIEQRVSGGTLSAIRALTTDVTDCVFLEESVTTQIDSFARRLRATTRPLIGPHVLDDRFFDLFSAAVQGVRRRVLSLKELKTIKFLRIYQDPTRPDGFALDFELTPYFSGAHGVITFYI